MRGQHQDLYAMVDDLAIRLADGATQPDIADDFNIMLKKGDRDLLFKNWGHQESVSMKVPLDYTPVDPRVIFWQNRSEESVREVPTFCGSSGGMEIPSTFGNIKAQPTLIRQRPIQGIMGNSWGFTAKKPEDYTGENAKNDPNLCKCRGEKAHFHCPGKDENGKDCRNKITVGKGISECPKCKTGKKCN